MYHPTVATSLVLGDRGLFIEHDQAQPRMADEQLARGGQADDTRANNREIDLAIPF
jgi:hypothetical protein